MNPIATYYAIRKKGTYLFLPACDRGATHTEPTDCTVFPPRFFKERKHANMALRCWVKGRWVTTYNTTDDLGPFGGETFETRSIEPVPERDIKDMEVVQIHLRLNQEDML